MENLTQNNDSLASEKLSFERFRQEVLNDYRLAVESREASLLGRKEVLTGKAKFGIFGDGKEVPQVAMAKFFRPGDFYAGYYRDQTFAFATGTADVEQFFSQLYADPNPENDPFSAGRQMNSHFATPQMDPSGNLVDLANRKNLSSGIAPTAGQMPRALGLAYASKLFRQVEQLKSFPELSNNGDEICFCTIGDASTSEGHFWETMNAAGVMQVPLAVFVWDDGYGISVPKAFQTTKGSISEALKGMQKKDHTNGFDIYRVKGWDYAGMCELFEEAIQKIRDTHIPALFHVEEITQPQGHSTSGSHERYKTAERLAWEREWDGLKKFREFLLTNALSDREELELLEREVRESVKESKNRAWQKYIQPVLQMVDQAVGYLEKLMVQDTDRASEFQQIIRELKQNREPHRRDVLQCLHRAIFGYRHLEAYREVASWYTALRSAEYERYNSHLYDESAAATTLVATQPAVYKEDAPLLNGYEILNKYFDELFSKHPRVVAFGEDVGHIGDVNQGFAGLQEKHGVHRISDTGIREQTIMGQGLGLALRGLRPIAEIQYLDYLLYGLQTLSDDVATTHFRTKGKQVVPLIVRTRGHRLEGIWHSGSPMGMMLNSLRGMHICVPRNMVQAAAMYNTLLQGNDPGIVVECLNGYRLKERMPLNLMDMRVELGVPEILKEGEDITLVSYGSMLRLVMEAAQILEERGISCEVIDVQTLLPFDKYSIILSSLKKTNKIAFLDEDVPGGATAFLYQQVLEVQGGFKWLDGTPRTLSAKAHRPAYGSDGDYFSKPNVEDILDLVEAMAKE